MFPLPWYQTILPTPAVPLQRWTVMYMSNLYVSSHFLWFLEVDKPSWRGDGSVQFSRSVVSDSLWHHELQYARLSCPSPTPGACSNSCLSSQWYHPTFSSSVAPFSSCLQSFPASVSFPVSQFFASGGQSIGVSASASVLPMNIQDWFPECLVLIIYIQNSSSLSQWCHLTISSSATPFSFCLQSFPASSSFPSGSCNDQ